MVNHFTYPKLREFPLPSIPNSLFPEAKKASDGQTVPSETAPDEKGDCMEASMDRRTFIGGAAAGAALAGLGMAAPALAYDETPEEWAAKYADYMTDAPGALSDCAYDVDVLVCGSGTAGVSCAIEAANAGLSVLMVEAASDFGGASCGAEGIIALHSSFLDELEDFTPYDTERVANDEYRASAYLGDYGLIHDFVTNIDDDYQWMVDNGVAFEGVEHFNPCQHFYEGKGKQMIATLIQKAQDLGVTCLTDNRVRKAIMSDGRVAGAIVEGPDGEYSVKSKAVVIATGCFAGDSELVSKYFPWIDTDRIVITTQGVNEGDGQKIAWACGGNSHGTCVPSFYDPALKSFFFLSELSVAACNTPYFWVNGSGERFVNEDLTIRYSEVCFAVLGQARAISILPQSAVDRIISDGFPVGWAAYFKTGDKPQSLQQQLDDAMAEMPEGFYVADSLDELPDVLGIDAETFSATVEHYRELAEKGVDEDFGKDPQYCDRCPRRTSASTPLTRVCRSATHSAASGLTARCAFSTPPAWRLRGCTPQALASSASPVSVTLRTTRPRSRVSAATVGVRLPAS